MPTKTDRILSYLPRTFRALPKPTALHSVVDSFGRELLMAENSLAAIMMAHWVDQADRGSEFIEDLAKIASLYGLQPRPDESVEEFRGHLKRYIRIFIEGTTTVQGILRVAAESLGLRIADDYASMDTWWTRTSDALTTSELRGDDASRLIFGMDSGVRTGRPATPAFVRGRVHLRDPIDLAAGAALRIKVDNAAPIDIDLVAGLTDLGSATLAHVIRRINEASQGAIAREEGGYLSLYSPTVGSQSRIEVFEVDKDAAPGLLGLALRRARGREARQASVVGRIDLGGGANLMERRYLRLQVDDLHLAEIDCAGANAAATSLTEITEAINQALALSVAFEEGGHLRLTSPIGGLGSRIGILPAAAQDARALLFGEVESFHLGSDAGTATLVGTSDLGLGVDLSGPSKVRVKLEDRPAITVDCAGSDPARTLPSEIVATIIARLGAGAATHDGRFISLSSASTGPGSRLVLEPLPPDEDAADLIFGIYHRVVVGSAATAAKLVSTEDLTGGRDLGALHLVKLSVDGGAPIDVDLRSHADDLRAVTLGEMRTAINERLGAPIASEENGRLALSSPTVGAASRIEIEALRRICPRRFVTRAFVSGEAAQSLFGFFAKQAEGSAATGARLVGTADLSRGVDLREGRYLRIYVDGGAPIEIDCAGPRPRATTLAEIAANINNALGANTINDEIATHDGQRLTLSSRTVGGQSRIALESTRAADALETLLGLEPKTIEGRDPATVRFAGTIDLTQGIDLSQASRIKIGIDGEAPVEIDCQGPRPEQTTLQDVVMRINVALGRSVAESDGRRVTLSALKPGDQGRLRFEVPGQPDATAKIFGITPPREYHGEKARPAQATGVKDLSGNVDLGIRRFLRLAFNGGPMLDIDCAAGASKPESATLPEIVTAIRDALATAKLPGVVRDNGKNLIIETELPGGFTRLALMLYTAGDARTKLLGDAPAVSSGSEPGPAEIVGEADLLGPANLEERRMLRLSVDDAPAVDIEVAGTVPGLTTLEEIIEKINAVLPQVASATENDRLRLRSPSRGATSRLSVLPLRTLDLIEYPPEDTADPAASQSRRRVNPGTRWRVTNDGAAESDLTVELETLHGIVEPSFVNLTNQQCLTVPGKVPAGARLELRHDAAGKLRGTIRSRDGRLQELSDDQIVITPLGARPGLGSAFVLPRGTSEWTITAGEAARFDQAHFFHARFAGCRAPGWGLFNVSRLGEALFAPTPLPVESEVEIRFRWLSYRPGGLVVQLPADLPPRFGARFNRSRFAMEKKAPEKHEQVVSEPLGDDDHLIKRLNAKSSLVAAQLVARVPIGFSAVAIPFRRPRSLTGGSEKAKGRIYLMDRDVDGFIEVAARSVGVWGNALSVAVQKVAPARFDVNVSFAGGRFENARQVVLGGTELPPLVKEALRPGPLGLLQSKAAGIRARVIRDRTVSQT